MIMAVEVLGGVKESSQPQAFLETLRGLIILRAIRLVTQELH